MKGINDALFNDIMIQSGLAHLQLRSFSAAEAILGKVAPELVPFCNPKLYNSEIVAHLSDTKLPERNDINSVLWDRIKTLERIELTRQALMTFPESKHDVPFEELPIPDENVIIQAIMHHPLAKLARIDGKNKRVVFCAYFGA